MAFDLDDEELEATRKLNGTSEEIDIDNIKFFLGDLKASNYNSSFIEGVENLIQENKKLNKKRKNGTLSDGCHTYNDLYYQRCVLFATICNLNKDKSWKSKKHSDGKKCFDNDNWFIVGIDTPEGSYTYHYKMKYWDMFNVKELEVGKIWDGHTEKDVTRLLTLEEGE